MSWSRDVLTDYRGAFDTARWSVVVLVIAGIAIQTWDVVVNNHLFNALGFLGGAGGLLAGLWGALHGDTHQMNSQRPNIAKGSSEVDDPDA